MIKQSLIIYPRFYDLSKYFEPQCFEFLASPFFTFKTTHIFVIGTCIEYVLDIHLKLSWFSEWITDPNDLAYLKLKNVFVSSLGSLGSFKSVIQQVLEENWIPERSTHQKCFIMKRALFENFAIFIGKSYFDKVY